MQRDYAKAFRVIRAAFGLQQSELAARMGVTGSQLSLIESGKRQPSVRTVDALSKAVGIPAALITLLASTPEDLRAAESEDISSLARSLLRVIVDAADSGQQMLKLQA